jgi:DNA-binding transcriptional regulator LsrR (DeoR family)
MHVDLRKLLAILAVMDHNPAITRSDLARATGLSLPTISRLLRVAREEGGVDVRWDAQRQQYQIHDWGAFNPVYLATLRRPG